MSAPMMIKQHAVNDRYPEKDRRTIFFENLTDHIRRGLLAAKNRSQPVEQRESETVAEPISERQSRRGKQPIAFTELQRFAAKSFVRVRNVRLAVHRALWFASAARGVKDKRVRVFICAHRKRVIQWTALRAGKILRAHSGKCG